MTNFVAERYFDLILWLAGAGHFLILAASFQVPQRLRWKQDLAQLMDFSEKYNILQSAMAASERIFKMLDKPVEVVSPAVTKKPAGPGRIEFDHVWFAYKDVPVEDKTVGSGNDHVGTAAPGRPGERSSAAAPSNSDAAESTATPDWVLRDVTFAIEPGETAAVVGHTGAGKTTLISLLLRFYDVQKGAVRIDGVDVKDMRAAGCDTVIDTKDLAVVGITEILSHLPKILGLYKNLLREVDRRKPDLAIVIDSPAFNWRVARQMKKRGIPTVYYVAPQFWAWRQGRVRLLRDYIDKALVIFPFEEKFYRDRGVDATFVGHPLAELPNPTITRAEYAEQFKLDPKKFWITLMVLLAVARLDRRT